MQSKSTVTQTTSQAAGESDRDLQGDSGTQLGHIPGERAPVSASQYTLFIVSVLPIHANICILESDCNIDASVVNQSAGK